jgi:hypothetical protein
MVDDATYHVASFDDTPIVCELDPGKHTLRMSRDDQILYEEEFMVPPGGHVVLAAHEHADDASLAPAPSVDPSESVTANQRKRWRTPLGAFFNFR